MSPVITDDGTMHCKSDSKLGQVTVNSNQRSDGLYIYAVELCLGDGNVYS